MKNLIRHYTRQGSKYYRYSSIITSKLYEIGIFPLIKVDQLKMYFLLSTGRTGTKFLAKFLNMSAQNYAVHEPLPNLLHEGNDYLRGILSKEKLSQKVIASRQKYFKESICNNAVNYIESNNRLYSFVPVLREIFPNAKFIHVVRDGREVVRSAMSRNFYTKNDTAYRISADQIIEDPYKSKWENMDVFEKVCWWWWVKDKSIFNATDGYSDSIRLKFEEIFDQSNNYTGLKKLLDFIDSTEITDQDIKINMKKENQTKSFTFDHWTEWSKETKIKFEKIAGSHMRNLGYDL